MTALKGDMTRISLRLRSRLIVINPEFESYFQKPLCKSGLWILEKYLIPENIAELDVEKLQGKLKKNSRGIW